MLVPGFMLSCSFACALMGCTTEKRGRDIQRVGGKCGGNNLARNGTFLKGTILEGNESVLEGNGPILEGNGSVLEGNK